MICSNPFEITAKKILIDIPNCSDNYNKIFKECNLKYDNIIVKSEYHREQIEKINNIDKSKIIVIPNGIRYNNFINCEENRNPYRFCYCNNLNSGFTILEKIWSIIYNYEPKSELHIYNLHDLNISEEHKNRCDKFLCSPGVMYHGNQPIDMISREKKISKYDFFTSTSLLDVNDMYLKESLLSGCIPITLNLGMYKNMDGIKIENIDNEYRFIAINVINIIKKNKDFNELVKNKMTEQEDWEHISSLWSI